ncbi:MAG: hypothetical protein CVT67_07375 [Actinobacteria bacterium HGW-Actinobacteria-7]|jgi:vacuolar-type H+-ATPase subunit E/Vma4|nr:MAG: hypothetical protein CVT67_07375 [Actinobacteria bacterium HGW-Actinobacteria-7]
MALEEVLRALEAEAQARCSEIRGGANQKAEQISEQARLRCEEIVHERLDAHNGAVAVQARRMVNQARMEARHTVSAERDRLIEELFDGARTALAAVRGGNGYRVLMGRLLDEALAGANGASGVLADPRDKSLVEELLGERGIDLPVRGEITTDAGVVMLSHEDRVEHDNTAEARLARVRELSRERVGEMLFG